MQPEPPCGATVSHTYDPGRRIHTGEMSKRVQVQRPVPCTAGAVSPLLLRQMSRPSGQTKYNILGEQTSVTFPHFVVKE